MVVLEFLLNGSNHHEGRSVKALKYTAYTPIAEKMIRAIEQEIQNKYAVSYIQVIHRIGALDIEAKQSSQWLMRRIEEKLLWRVKRL